MSFWIMEANRQVYLVLFSSGYISPLYNIFMIQSLVRANKELALWLSFKSTQFIMPLRHHTLLIHTIFYP